MFITETAALSSLQKEEALRLMHTAPNLKIEGTFSSKPSFQHVPDGSASLRRDSMEDFFFGADVSPSDSDAMMIRRTEDGSLAFILTRRGALFLSFRAAPSTNSLRFDGDGAYFTFDRVVMAEGSEEKSWTDMAIHSGHDGRLEVEVTFRNRHTALAIPYDHSAAKWAFSLERIQ